MIDRYFYHSFPRRGGAVGDAGQMGLRILESICQNGLLLVPEVVSWHDPLQIDQNDPIRAYQRRICFTELAPAELKEHATVFGDFAIEFSISALRSLGALPVIYVPDRQGEGASLDAVGAAFLSNAAGAISMLSKMAKYSKLHANPLTFNLTMRSGERTTTSFSPKEMAGVRRFIGLMEKSEGIPLESMANALGKMASLFYPTENLKFTGPLEYYRQREWRIVSGIRMKSKDVTQLATSEQVQQLLTIDKCFFSRPITFPDGTFSIAEKSHFTPSFGDQHVLTMTRRIVVPPAHLDAATAILAKRNLTTPIVTTDAVD